LDLDQLDEVFAVCNVANARHLGGQNLSKNGVIPGYSSIIGVYHRLLAYAPTFIKYQCVYRTRANRDERVSIAASTGESGRRDFIQISQAAGRTVVVKSAQKRVDSTSEATRKISRMTQRMTAGLIHVLTHMIIIVSQLYGPMSLAPKEGCSPKQLNEFPFLLIEEEVMQDPDGRRQVII
jgi:hypothetical protein